MRIIPEQTDNAGIRFYSGSYPSVTSVLKVIEKPHIATWRNRIGAKEADRILADAQVLGTKVHTLVEKIGKGEDPEVEQEMQPYRVAVEKFLSTWVEEVIACEIPLVSSRYGFGGTADMYVRLKKSKGGGTAVVDFKTTKQGLSREHGLQAAAYGLLLIDNGYPVDRRLVVWIKKHPPEKVGELYVREYHDHREDRDGFLGALALFRWIHASRLNNVVTIPE
jgi:hypothetical protein